MPALETEPKLGDCIGNGIECEVYEYGKSKVIKIFSCRDIAKKALENQRYAFENGLAPAVFCDDPICIDEEKYGIIVERVETLSENDYESDKCGEPIDDDSEFFQKYRELKQSLFEVFGEFHDLHIGNLGWKKNGRLVCIDFGESSIE